MVERIFNPEIIEKTWMAIKLPSQGQPDFVKLMSDGYFAYPNPAIHKGLENISDLAGIEPLGADHPWITEQVELVKNPRWFWRRHCGYLQYLCSSDLLQMVGRRSFRWRWLIANFIDQDAATLKKYWTQLAKILQVWANESLKKQEQPGSTSVFKVSKMRVSVRKFTNKSSHRVNSMS